MSTGIAYVPEELRGPVVPNSEWRHGYVSEFTQETGETVTVGQLVHAQMYSPRIVDGRLLGDTATLAERKLIGNRYGPRKLMLLKAMSFEVVPPNLVEWHQVKFCLVDPDRPNDESLMSWPNADWCELEDASATVGMLF